MYPWRFVAFHTFNEICLLNFEDRISLDRRLWESQSPTLQHCQFLRPLVPRRICQRRFQFQWLARPQTLHQHSQKNRNIPNRRTLPLHQYRDYWRQNSWIWKSCPWCLEDLQQDIYRCNGRVCEKGLQDSGAGSDYEWRTAYFGAAREWV